MDEEVVRTVGLSSNDARDVLFRFTNEYDPCDSEDQLACANGLGDVGLAFNNTKASNQAPHVVVL
jgi:hypothetical protein